MMATISHPDDDPHFSTAWFVVRRWLISDPAGRKVLEQLVDDPEQGAEVLRSRLDNTTVPGLGATVSGGMLGKLVQVASAEAVHVHSETSAESLTQSPAELPNAMPGFTGRKAQLGDILAMCDAARTRAVPAVAVIVGQGGVGKSALTIQAGHALAQHYPHGQLYVNLQGSTPGVKPLEVVEVLGRFLRALGVDGKDIPVHAEEAAARFRSITVNRQLLVLLDNAGSVGQVRHLLPAGPQCATLITSRTPLNSLDGATHHHLDVLSHDDALDLLRQFTGDARIANEPEDAQQIVTLCARLPLALRIASARLAARPSWPLQYLAKKLANETQRLNELRVGDLAIRASFQVSYAALLNETGGDSDGLSATQMFHLFGLVDGAQMSGHAAAALADAPTYVAEDALEQLVDAQLVETTTPGRYQMHDLIRLFAVEHAKKHIGAPEQHNSLERLLGFYCRSAQIASRFLQAVDPRRSTTTMTTNDEIDDRASAIEWFEAERTNLVAATRQAAAGSKVLAGYAVHIADAAFWFCHQRMYSRDLQTLNMEALKAAQKVGDRMGQSQALHNLTIACIRLRQLDLAVEYGNQACKLREDLDDRYGLSRTLDALGRAHFALGDHRQAADYGERALTIAHEIDDEYSESAILCNLVPVYLALTRTGEAISVARRSLKIRTELGDIYGEARMRVSLGVALKKGGNLLDAIDCFSHSKEVFTRIGDRYNQGRTLLLLAEASSMIGNTKDAAQYAFECAAVRREAMDRYGEAEALRLLGKIYRDRSEDGKAREFLHLAEAISADIGATGRQSGGER